ncbi:OsmC family protein [Mesorhizobium sp. BAC0120]|uniref:OsmC family protein n=1 Tax=Mesorhizobium sp. BAC0120 TaxID=3090670 RepID=UPI00298D1365|nr:OsmC family protein [Mesorhizobium sp. BAC0120]MDW6020841.1 OsmC family protein [Mesorhizobium sp. BAC0120]
MDRNAQIRGAQERVIAVYREKPEAAFSSVRASAQVGEGLTCRFRQGHHEAVMDMSKVIGGDEKGPTPGFFIRAGLAGCIAIGIKLTAAREGVAIDTIDVDVEMDFDDGAMFGVGSNTAAPLETRFKITLQSSAPWEEVTAMVDRALAADPYFLALRDAQSVSARVVRGKA